jgi:uncharacterized tellurite resistance protein B-like protein
MKHKTRTNTCNTREVLSTLPFIGLRETNMHILALLGAIVAGAGVWYWRYRQARDIGGEILDAVGTVRGAYNRRNFRKKAEGSVLNSIDDPALAAAVFLFALANETDRSDPAAELEIRRQITPIVPANKLDEVLAYAAWAARSVIDPQDCVRRFRALWRDHLDTAERDQLIAMARAVSAATPSPRPTQAHAIDALRTALDPENRRA